ncbi:MAG: hypothetical protein AAGA56_27220 [Myxococcota bacterium]
MADPSVMVKTLQRSFRYYRNNGLLAALLGLVACAATAGLDREGVKAVALAGAIVFVIAAFRSLRHAQRYLDPASSPVLLALTQRPERVADAVKHNHNDGLRFEVTTHDGDRLLLLAEPDDEAELERVLAAMVSYETS